MATGDCFPAGMRILVVDDDPLCLIILERMLRQCSYTVTTCNRATQALALLRVNKDKFDLVISDVYMPDMDGFKLLELIGLELDLPVIMMSAHGETSVVMKGITHGACDYLLKPVRIEELRNIWQHVIRKKKIVIKDEHEDDNGETCEGTEKDYGQKKRKEKVDGEEQLIEDMNNLKKARVVWSFELHQQFVNAVNQLGIDKAVPKKIMDIMNVQGLTRENVASHLQKYRLYLKRLSGVENVPHPVATFRQAPPDAPFGGTMQINPGGRGTLSVAGHRPMSIGSMGGAGRGAMPQLDPGTLASLAQLQQLQQATNQDRGTSGAVRGLITNSSAGFGLPSLMSAADAQGMSGLDLEMFMHRMREESSMRQRLSLEAQDDSVLAALQIVGLESGGRGLSSNGILPTTATMDIGEVQGLDGNVSLSGFETQGNSFAEMLAHLREGSIPGSSDPVGGDLLNQLMSQAARTRMQRQTAAQAYTSG